MNLDIQQVGFSVFLWLEHIVWIATWERLCQPQEVPSAKDVNWAITQLAIAAQRAQHVMLASIGVQTRVLRAMQARIQVQAAQHVLRATLTRTSGHQGV